MDDTYYAHVHAKAAVLKLEDIMRNLGMTPPDRPPVGGSGDAYYAHYWAKHASNMATLVEAKTSPA